MSMNEYSQLDNDSLRLVLLKNGIEAGPVNELTRKVYLNKLARIAVKDSPSKSQVKKDHSENAPPEPVHMKTRASQSIGEFFERAGPDCSSTPAIGVNSKPQGVQRRALESNQTGTGSPRKQASQQNEVQATALTVSRQAEPQSASRLASATAASEKINATFTKPEPQVRSAIVSRVDLSTLSPSVTLISRDHQELECDSAKRPYLSDAEREALRHRLSQAIKPRKPIDKPSGISSDSLSIEHSRTFTVESNSGRLEPAMRHVDSVRHRRAPTYYGLTKFKSAVVALLLVVFFIIGYLTLAPSSLNTYQLSQ